MIELEIVMKFENVGILMNQITVSDFVSSFAILMPIQCVSVREIVCYPSNLRKTTMFACILAKFYSEYFITKAQVHF